MKRKILISLFALAGLLLFVFFKSFPLPFCNGEKFPVVRTENSCSGNKIVFVSDTQQQIWAETFFLEENGNDTAREAIFAKILDEKPAAVFHLGDLTAYGYCDNAWAPIDNFVEKLNSLRVPFYPAFGNHEYILYSSLGRKNFAKRFPDAEETGYAVRCGNALVILLNSNFSELTKEETENQKRKYFEFLGNAEKDTTIKAVIVATHYSPFTNSKIVSPSEEVRREFLPAFFSSSKAKLFISGHAHALERFKVRGKNFLVIGGGGGLQQPLFTGDDEKYKDLFDNHSPRRPFHFLEIETRDDTLFVSAQILNDDFKTFRKVTLLSVPEL